MMCSASLPSGLGAEHRGFDMTPREIIDETLKASGRRSLEELDFRELV